MRRRARRGRAPNEPRRIRRGAAALGLLALALVAHRDGRAADAAFDPGAIDGLVAWYEAETVHKSHGDGATVAAWEDSSGHGHTLTDDETGLSATFQAPGVGREPHVLLHKGDTYSVAKPFVLEDHTIVVVYAAGQPARALFRSDLDDGHGVVLRVNSRRDQYQNGSSIGGKTFAYGLSLARGDGFDVTILARREGVLRQFENGSDVSSGVEFREPLRVGKFFGVQNTRYSSSDGDGLRIAEMLFYDRYLDGAERHAVLRYVARRHGIALGARRDTLPLPDARTHRVRLTTDRAASLGRVGPAGEGGAPTTEMATVAWNVQDALTYPFRHDAELSPERLRCARDGTRTDVTVLLPVLANVPGVRLRVLLLKNGKEYLPGDARSAELPTTGRPAVLRLDTEIDLDEGDYVTVVTAPEGPPGAEARLVADGATLIVPGP